MLRRSVDSSRVSHAQLFSGLCGCGTLSLAIAYLQYLNCTSRHDGDSCGECPSCVKMREIAHPDIHYIFPIVAPKGMSGDKRPTCDYYMAQWRQLICDTGGYFDIQDWYSAMEVGNQQGIISRSDADEIIRKLSYKSFEAEYKAVIIWQPEKMRTEAANALLKILEEPWEKTVFILVSTAPDKLLPTILSRCQHIAIYPIEEDVLSDYLCQDEGTSRDKANVLARLCSGDLLQARRKMDQSSGDSSKEDFDLFASLMRLSYNDKHMELMEWADKVASMGREEQKRFLIYSLHLLRESYVLSSGLKEIVYLWGDEAEFCSKFAPFISNHNIEELVGQFELAIAQVGQNANPRILFTHFALAVSKMIVRL